MSGSETRIRIRIAIGPGPAPGPGSRSGDWHEHRDRRGAAQPRRFTRGPWERPAAARGWVRPGPAGPRRPPELPPPPAAAGGEVPPPPAQPWLRAAVTLSWPRPGPGEPRAAPGSFRAGCPSALGGCLQLARLSHSLVKGLPRGAAEVPPPRDELLAQDKFSVFQPLLKDRDLRHKINITRMILC